MRITAVTGRIHSTPFDYGNPAGPGGNLHLRAMDTLLVEVTTDAGLTGLGEGFGFTLVGTTKEALERLIAPACLGEAADDIPALMTKLHRRFHNFGRNGPVTFALAGLDIALWDLAAQLAGKPLHALLGGAKRDRVPAYASLLRYGVPALVAANAEKAVARGYRHIKLHEVDLACIEAARRAAPAEIPLMLDINCAWPSIPEAVAFCQAVKGWNIGWVEEPIWPPEDFAGIAAVRAAGHTPVSAGECLGSPGDIANMLAAGAVDVVQPSVTKIGLTGLLAVAAEARRRGVALVPHSPYFGPGLAATLHYLAAAEQEQPIEIYFADLARPPYPALAPEGGFVAVPQGVGLGLTLAR
ncbi:mandelate racemase/muconate lactonizing enzyme family protein [Siccirubricoccus phaeus]|uniref:mandelate racemase/muconate lactonizing enzyme family protein n=1 Tax=Siccirubricoccus phaeus TaxID=2595053 RepID=UPI0011F3C9A7|nr:mandelate racemase/muconate lactonizing enzyme family protein [Siccirubricoccus phaeus]